MGSAEDTTPHPKPQPPKPAPLPPSSTPPVEVEAPATSQEPQPGLPATPAYSADWATTVHAYYSGAAAAAAGTPPSFYSPPVWGSQLMSPYGTPIPYSPMYPVYAHPCVATAAGYPAAESGCTKPKGGEGGGGGSGKSGDGGKVTSGSADEYGSHSGGESGSEGSSDTRDNGTETQDAARKRSFGDAFIEGDTSKAITAGQNNGTTAESSYSGRQRTVSKLPVSAPGRTTLPGPATNLNIGIDVWSTSAVGTVPKDERELKRERRKQSNRESARRSRIRKQLECEDLAKKVSELNSENSALKLELEQLYKVCKDIEADNASITEGLNRMAKTGLPSDFEGNNGNSSNARPAVVSEGGGHAPQNPIGSNGQVYNLSGNFESVTR